jgi:hypothetical protein
MDGKQRLQLHIAALESQLDDLKGRLPAHSIPPAMILELDRLDEQLNAARQQLARLAEEER